VFIDVHVDRGTAADVLVAGALGGADGADDAGAGAVDGGADDAGAALGVGVALALDGIATGVVTGAGGAEVSADGCPDVVHAAAEATTPVTINSARARRATFMSRSAGRSSRAGCRP
jgi:hypothetical protein